MISTFSRRTRALALGISDVRFHGIWLSFLGFLSGISEYNWCCIASFSSFLCIPSSFVCSDWSVVSRQWVKEQGKWKRLLRRGSWLFSTVLVVVDSSTPCYKARDNVRQSLERQADGDDTTLEYTEFIFSPATLFPSIQ